MDLGLKGKVAVVAGSSQGLGRAIADSLAEDTSGAEGVVLCNLQGLVPCILQSYETPLTTDTISRIEAALKAGC